MNQVLRIKWLLIPSSLGGSAVIIATTVITATNTWAYIAGSQLFYDYLFSARGAFTALQSVQASVIPLTNNLLSNDLLYDVLVAIAAVVAGLVAYWLLELIHTLWGDGFGPNHILDIDDVLIRILVRIAGFTGWVFYMTIFLLFLMPLDSTFIQLALDGAANGNLKALWYFVPAVLFLALILHIHIIFARITLLRVRLFGGIDVRSEILELEQNSSHKNL